MPATENSAQRYFRLVRKAQQQGSPADGLLSLVRLATDAVQCGDRQAALTALTGLQQVISTARPVLNGTEQRHKDLVEIMRLRKDNLELTQLLALARGDEAAAAEIEQAIGKMDEFFAVAIADLDPDRDQGTNYRRPSRY